MFLVPGLKAPRSADTSMESSGWGVPGCPHSQPTRGLGSVVSSHMKWGIFKILFYLFIYLRTQHSTSNIKSKIQ